MKKIALLLFSLFSLMGICAQNYSSSKIPIGVFVSEDAEVIPPIAHAALINKMRQIVTANGLGANNQAQFFITGLVNVTDREIIGGAPTKIIQKIDVTFYIVDAATDKIFDTETVSTRGVGENENKAYISALKAIQPTNANLKNFVIRSGGKILSYYESQIDNIITKAESLAKVGDYEAALYELSIVPEACAGFDRIATEASTIYQMMIDTEAFSALQKAKTLWAAGHNFEAANEAGEYLATISPYSTYYKDAEALTAEISQFVRSEHAYARAQAEDELAWRRKQQQDRLDWQRKMSMEQNQRRAEEIAAWRAVGEAYGKNQKPVTYNVSWLVR